ncbi:MAG: hypothetical protein AB1477_06295 [Acidobacteriota bacterium]
MEKQQRKINLRDVICIGCGLPGNLDADRICELCRNRVRLSAADSRHFLHAAFILFIAALSLLLLVLLWDL